MKKTRTPRFQLALFYTIPATTFTFGFSSDQCVSHIINPCEYGLWNAARNGRRDAVLAYIIAGTDVDCGCVFGGGSTPLLAAIRYGRCPSTVQCLISEGADVTLITSVFDIYSSGYKVFQIVYSNIQDNILRNRILRKVSRRGSTRHLQFILESGGIDVNAKDSKAIVNAASGWHNQRVQLLLNYGSNVPDRAITAAQGCQEIQNILKERRISKGIKKNA